MNDSDFFDFFFLHFFLHFFLPDNMSMMLAELLRRKVEVAFVPSRA